MIEFYTQFGLSNEKMRKVEERTGFKYIIPKSCMQLWFERNKTLSFCCLLFLLFIGCLIFCPFLQVERKWQSNGNGMRDLQRAHGKCTLCKEHKWILKLCTKINLFFNLIS